MFHNDCMRAAWYDEQGPAASVLRVGELPEPTPGPGEVRVRVRFSGINPGDTKKRAGWLGSSMPYPRVIPHSDGAGVIDATAFPMLDLWSTTTKDPTLEPEVPLPTIRRPPVGCFEGLRRRSDAAASGHTNAGV